MVREGNIARRYLWGNETMACSSPEYTERKIMSKTGHIATAYRVIKYLH
jgi:hypothetical protein